MPPSHPLIARCLLSLAALSGAAPSAQASTSLDLLVPAYFYPSYLPSQNEWLGLTAALGQGVGITAVMNPGNGPGASLNSDYVAAVSAFQSAGGRVVGYDYTCYGISLCTPEVPATRSTGEVLADAGRYASWYGVQGIFLDETASSSAAQSFYASVAQGLRSEHPGWQIVANPGVIPDSRYYALADTVVSFEGSGTSFLSSGYLQTIASSGHAGQDAAIVHSVASVADMQAIVAQAKAAGLGSLYVTDGDLASGNPYLHLPSYWNAEVAAFATSPVPEPASAALMAAGLCALGLRRRRR